MKRLLNNIFYMFFLPVMVLLSPLFFLYYLADSFNTFNEELKNIDDKDFEKPFTLPKLYRIINSKNTKLLTNNFKLILNEEDYIRTKSYFGTSYIIESDNSFKTKSNPRFQTYQDFQLEVILDKTVTDWFIEEVA